MPEERRSGSGAGKLGDGASVAPPVTGTTPEPGAASTSPPEERWTVSCCDEHPWGRVRFRGGALACFACEREGITGVPHFHNVEVAPASKLKEQEERCERLLGERDDYESKLRDYEQMTREALVERDNAAEALNRALARGDALLDEKERSEAECEEALNGVHPDCRWTRPGLDFDALGRITVEILRGFGECFAEAAGDRDRTFWLSAYAPEREVVRQAFTAVLEHSPGDEGTPA